MAWLYLRDPEVPIKVPPERVLDPIMIRELTEMKGLKRGAILDWTKDDPSLAGWLMPVVRARLRWMEDLISHHQDLRMLAHSELSSIDAYLYTHGSLADLETFESIIAAASEAGIQLGFPATRPSLQIREATLRR